MNDIYQALNRAKEKKPVSKQVGVRLPKEEYARMKKEQRQALYDMAEIQSKTVVSNGETYLKFLDLQSRLDYTVTNTLLVFAQNPNAKVLKDSEHWRESKSFIKKDEKGIRILEPKGEYQKADGSVRTNYDVKSVFDISQVNTKLKYEEPNVSQRNIISALVYDSPVKIEEIPGYGISKQVVYSSETKTIYYPSGLSPNELIQGLAREYCYAEFDNQYGNVNRDKDKVFVESSAYMLCQKYGVKVNDTSFTNDIVEYFDGMDAMNIKAELSNIKNLCDDVSKRMERGLFKSEQEHQLERHEEAR